MSLQDLPEGRRRVAIERVRPEIDAGRFAIKRVSGETVDVTADVFTDGHDRVAAVLVYRHEDQKRPREVAMTPLGNDRFAARFTVDRLGRYRYTVEAWVDRFATWRHDLEKRVAAGQDVGVDLRIGAELVAEAADRARGADRAELGRVAELLAAGGDGDVHEATAEALEPGLLRLVRRHDARRFKNRYARELPLVVDRERARFSAWYELFPRSASPEPGRHGTFKDTTADLDRIAGLGFDVLYLPPIHPIGRVHRKGRNNAPAAEPGDVGSPWAIGAEEGGHDAIHPDLGTAADFRELVAEARERGIDVALDLALQCAPDHPWVRSHPEWFRHRPDGTIQYAENPPKKYQDIYPLDFESDDWQALWRAIADVVFHWVGEGVRVFRVDNPHTKPFALWEWLIASVKAEHPDVIFLSEAFTRPKVMYRLAKLGFTQSYNYFPWRTTADELREYLTELTRTEVAEYFRPNLWPNTPDILTEQLQIGGRAVFAQRLVLAATLGASYGIYGPPYELAEATPREVGGEEYLDSEKYQLRHWELDRPGSLGELIARVNRIRRDNPALQTNAGLHFHPSENETLLCYSKAAGENVVIVVAGLDPHYPQGGWIDLDYDALGLEPDRRFQVHELLTDARFLWSSGRNYVRLDPESQPAMVLRLRRRLRTERDFDYYL